MFPRTPYRKPLAIAALAMACAIATPTYAQSSADCAARADRATSGSGQVAGTAMAGAATGAAVGAIVGRRPGRAAGRGAAAGALVGAVGGSYRKNQTWNRVYDDCMYGYRY
jgi:hypothetical protein